MRKSINYKVLVKEIINNECIIGYETLFYKNDKLITSIKYNSIYDLLSELNDLQYKWYNENVNSNIDHFTIKMDVNI